MNGTLGSRLGGFLAHFEQAMMDDGCSAETLTKIHRISEIYRNFENAELRDFQHDFRTGYEAATKSISDELDAAPVDFAENFSGPQRG